MGKYYILGKKQFLIYKVKVLFQDIGDYTPLFGAPGGDRKSDFQKTTVTAKLSSSDRRKASDWVPVSDMGSNPYPVIPDCYSSPTSRPYTGLSEQEPGAATPPN